MSTPTTTEPQTLWFIDTVARVLVDGEETNGNYSVVDSVGPQGNMPPLHVHEREDEVFHVVEGQLTVFLPGEQVELNVGRHAPGAARRSAHLPRRVGHVPLARLLPARRLRGVRPRGQRARTVVGAPACGPVPRPGRDRRRRGGRGDRAPRPSRSAARLASETMPGMEITRIGIPTNPGPSDWFTGAVYLDPVAVPAGPSRLSATAVHFTPGARTAWHTHPNGQTIYVLEGVGLCRRRGGEIEVIRPGDRVFFEPGEEHWHGAAATRFMTHIAMLQVDEEGNNATWLEHVTDEEYGTAPPIDAC